MHSSPLFKLIFPFIIGLLWSIYLPFQENWILFVLLCILLCFSTIVIFFTPNILIFKNYKFTFALIVCVLILLGYNYTTFYNTNLYKDTILTYIEKNNLCEIVVSEMPVEGEKSIKTTVQIHKIKDSLGWHLVSEKVILYFQKDTCSSSLKYGDKLFLFAQLNKIKPPQNPHEFNYHNYLKNKHIFYQSYVQSDNWVCIKKESVIDLYSLAFGLRKKMLQLFKTKEFSPKESAIASALLLGWDEEIDETTLQSYASAGITHILSVSGLHVGILSWLIGGLFFFLQTAKQRIIKAVIQLLFIWILAFVTGLAPPVLRSAVMFSFIIVGQIINRKTNILNNLAASALLLLLIDPYVITDVGFQLSYLALLGIVTLQPMLSQYCKTKYKSTNYIIDLVTVSIAAQLTTMPFTLYYFHQFPVYFLLANVIIVPFSGVLLGTSLAVVAFSWIPYCGSFIAWALVYEIKTMNIFVEWIESMPFALLDSIRFSFIHAVLLAGIIFCIGIAFGKRNAKWILASLVTILLFLGYETVCYYQHATQNQWTIYSIGKKNMAITFSSGREALLLGNTNLLQNKNLQKFHIKNNLIQLGINKIQNVNITDSTEIKNKIVYKQNGFIQFRDIKLLLFSNEMAKQKSAYIPKVNYLVLCENPKTTIHNLLNQFRFDTLIITATNSNKNQMKWEIECMKLKIPYISIPQQGAFTQRLEDN